MQSPIFFALKNQFGRMWDHLSFFAFCNSATLPLFSVVFSFMLQIQHRLINFIFVYASVFRGAFDRALFVHALIDIVAKGGNYLLNVGPSPDGKLPPIAVERMHEIGKWMKINGDAIYETRPFFPYCEEKIRFTQKNNRVYAIYMLDEGEKLPESIVIKADFNKKKVRILGSKTKAKMTTTPEGHLININGDVSLEHAVVFELR